MPSSTGDRKGLCRIAKDNNPGLIEQILRSRGYKDIVVLGRETGNFLRGVIEEKEKTAEEDSTLKEDGVSSSPVFQWAQNAFAVDFSVLVGQRGGLNKNLRFANQLHGVSIGTKEGMLKSVSQWWQKRNVSTDSTETKTELSKEDFPPWYLPTFLVSDVLKKKEKELVKIHGQEGAHENKKSSSHWIYKTQTNNRGKGIEVFSNFDNLVTFLKDQFSSAKMSHNLKIKPTGIVQQYLQTPLLTTSQRKFDVRVFLLVARVEPFLAYYACPFEEDAGKKNPGGAAPVVPVAYLKSCACPFDLTDLETSARHITNQRVQREYLGAEQYSVEMNDLVQVFDTKFLNTTIPFCTSKERQHQVQEQYQKGLQIAMEGLAEIIQGQVNPNHLGSFQLFGCDFLFGEDGKVFLLEANRNPALHTNTEALAQIIPGLVAEAIRIVEAAHSTDETTVADDSRGGVAGCESLMPSKSIPESKIFKRLHI
ncbi:unnamed protein product [Amoebophrya sp. A120]|nr:unnamed protein product [Amoebophrya sp. A120]|eukprot:GSA120T00012849001.1